MPTKITLFPMVHVGERPFYDTVFSQAMQHDVVLYEGVRSSKARRLTRAYRLGKVERMGLVVQPSIKFDTGKARAVNADLSADEFEREWYQMPFWVRTALPLASAAVGMWLRLMGSREMLARHLEAADLPDRDELFAPEPIIRMLMTARDQRLCEVLQSEITNGTPSVAIVYGAAHMTAVAQFLFRFGAYRPISGEWLTVFEL